MKNGFKLNRKLLSLMFLTMTCTLAKAQPSLAFYPFDDQFNSSTFNPAFLTSTQKFTFSIIPIGGTSIGYNSQVIIKDLFTKILSGKSPSDDYYMNVLESMAYKAMFNQNIETTLLNFTYRSRIGFLNFRIKENEVFTASAKGDLTKFILKESLQTVVIDQIQALPSQAVHYREYSLGYSYKSPMKKFSAGIRAKLYFGKAVLFSSLHGSINNESGNYVFKTTGEVNVSFPQSTTPTAEGAPDITKISGSKIVKYLFNSGNMGFGVDLGINYRINPNLSFSMSIIDLGKINWKNNLSKRYFDPYTLPEQSIVVPDLGSDKIIKKDGFKYSKELPAYFLEDPNPTSFSRSLPLSIYAGIKYRLNPKLTISFTDRYMLVKDLSYNSYSVSANIDINKKLTISTGYSIIANSNFNLPVAVLLKKDFGQIYFGTDNIASFILPSISDYASFSFGTCFYLFKNKESRKSSSSDDYPFYRHQKTKKERKSGLIQKPYPES
jgi:hypothetical protein